MKKIIIPTDFSDNAQNAINYALELYKDETCKFYLLHTYTPVVYSYDYQMNISGYFGELADTIKENSEKQLQETKIKIQKKFKNTKHKIKTISSFNLLVDEIKRLIKKKGADLVVMGTKGATGAKEILFGSNTMHVIQKVNCPVLAIPDGYFFEKPKEVLFPTDYQLEYTDRQLDVINDIAGLYNSKIHIFHVLHAIELTVKEYENKNRLKKIFEKINYTFESSTNKNIENAIHDFKKSTYVQLLVMINNKHSFFENLFFRPVIHQIGFHLKVPFLVIPAKM